MSTEKTTEIVPAKDRKTLEEIGAKYGILDITDEEYEANKKYTVMTALQRIKNSRKGVHLARERSAVIGIPMGGRDFVYKGITVEESRTQFISVIEFTEAGATLRELTNWGHFKCNHGEECKFGVERSESHLNDGSVRENHTVKSADKTGSRAIRNMSDLLSSGIKILQTADLSEDNKYDVVAVRGEIGSVDNMPIWGTSDKGEPTRDGEYPLWLNDQPCLQIRLLSEDSKLTRLNFAPANLSKLLLSWPADFAEIIKSNDIQEALKTLIGSSAVAIGCVRKVRSTDEGTYFDIDATALFIQEPTLQETLPTTTEEPSASKKGKKKSTPAPAPAAPAAPAPQTKSSTPVEEYKRALAELMTTLGVSDLTPEDVRSAKILPESLSEALILALIKKVKSERQ